MSVRKPLPTVVIVLLAFLAIGFLLAGWFAWRVNSELGGRPWRNSNQVVARDGEVLLEFQGNVWTPAAGIRLEDLPEEVPLAFIAAEDVRFRSHFGIDPIGVARAALTNVRAGGVAQGGSTITQQVAKVRFFSQDRTFSRKALEAIVAPLIELRLSKDDILEAYLNDVYLGHHEGRAVLGIDEAARVYFDRNAEDLTLAQAAMLAGMVRAPNRDTAEKRPEVAKRRRDAILAVMRDQDWISESDFEKASETRISFRTGKLASVRHPWAIAAIRSEAIERIGSRRLRGGGLTIRTTIDRAMQRSAESAVSSGVQRLRRRHSWLRRSDEPLQAAILSVSTEDGGIRALVGGASWKTSQFDRTRSMRRQAGSALKPFTYAAAIANGLVTPATIVEDEPVEIQLAKNDIWSPHNYDERFRGDVTVREAFEKSLNVPAVRVAREVGNRKVRNVLDDAGFSGELSSTEAIALGVDEVTMTELAGAYTIFPNLGRRVRPHLIESVANRRGRVIHKTRTRSSKVLAPEVAYVVHSLMRGVVQRGTASALKRQGLGHVAGKTGTTNDYRDAWFVGYSPDLVTAAWVGFDGGRPLRISSGEAALPIWGAFMSRVEHEESQIEPPDGVVLARIERETGLLWREGCGSSVEEAFIAGSEPDRDCAPARRTRPEVEEYEEPTIITIGQLKQWIDRAPGVLSEVEVIEEPVENAPEGSQPGEIIIEYETEPEPEQISSPEEMVPPPPGEDLPPPDTPGRPGPPGRGRGEVGPPDAPPGQERKPPDERPEREPDRDSPQR